MNKGYNVLITGASRGIGHAIALEMSNRCSNMFITAHKQSSLNNGINLIRQQYHGNLYGKSIEQENSLETAHELYEWIKSRVDYLDILILSAGIFIEGDLCKIDSFLFNKNMDTNFNFNFYIVGELIQLLEKARKSPRIIIIGSTAAYGAYSVPTYSVAKWALRGYAINLRQELAKRGIGVTFISPGSTLTDMWHGEDIPLKRILEPTDIAKVINNLFDLSEQAVVEELIIRPMLGDIVDE